MALPLAPGAASLPVPGGGVGFLSPSRPFPAPSRPSGSPRAVKYPAWPRGLRRGRLGLKVTR